MSCLTLCTNTPRSTIIIITAYPSSYLSSQLSKEFLVYFTILYSFLFSSSSLIYLGSISLSTLGSLLVSSAIRLYPLFVYFHLFIISNLHHNLYLIIPINNNNNIINNNTSSRFLLHIHLPKHTLTHSSAFPNRIQTESNCCKR